MVLSIIILNYDTRDLLIQCLASIPHSAPDLELEILIVNNGSVRDRAASLEGLRPDAIILDLPVNVGFGQANNLAAAKAKGDYLLILNSDTYFLENSLARVGEFLARRPEIDFFGCRIFYPDGRVQRGHHVCPTGARARKLHELNRQIWDNPVLEKLRRTLPSGPAGPDTSETMWLTGCCIFARRQAYLETGGFDPDFYLYSEEVDWFHNRIFGRGYKIGLCDEVRVVHLEGASQAQQSMNQQSRLSHYLFMHKLGPGLFSLTVLINTINLLTRVFCIPFVPHQLEHNIQVVSIGVRALLEAIREVPWYARARASRPAPLLVSKYRKNYAWSKMSEAMLRPAVAGDSSLVDVEGTRVSYKPLHG